MEDNDVHLGHVEHAKRDRGTEVHGDGQGGRLNVHLETESGRRAAVRRISELAAECYIALVAIGTLWGLNQQQHLNSYQGE